MAGSDHLAETYDAAQTGTAAAVAALLVVLWRRVRAADVRGSWQQIAAEVTAVVAAGQRRAAELPGLYLAALLALADDAAAEVNTAAFTGTTAWGADLGSVLDVAPRVVLSRIGGGMPARPALRAGAEWLSTVATTEVGDAGRRAMDVAAGVRPGIAGYVRTLSAPSCARCVVLAGRLYRKNTGFARHPHCHCTHRAITRAEWDRHEVDPSVDPRSYFRSLPDAEQDRVFGKAGAEAIRGGADVGQVVNAARGMSVPGAPYTREGTTRRGVAGARLRGAPRLTPQAILARYGNDRAAYLQALKAHGYIL